MMDIKFYKEKTKEIRLELLRLNSLVGSCHIGGSLSCVELMVMIHYYKMKTSHANRHSPDRNRFILSKGHSSLTLYSILSDLDFFTIKELEQMCTPNSRLGSHPEYDLDMGIEATTGSLGHGLSISCGLALSNKMDGRDNYVVTLLGDGECQEGSVWEAAMFAAHHGLDNLYAVIDHNKLQAIQPISEVLNIMPLAQRWSAFGWSVIEVDGHNLIEIQEALDRLPFEKNKPSLIIGHTIKGKGVSFMEGVPLWHYRKPNDKEYEIALNDLRGISI
jgi:transketolase